MLGWAGCVLGEIDLAVAVNVDDVYDRVDHLAGRDEVEPPQHRSDLGGLDKAITRGVDEVKDFAHRGHLLRRHGQVAGRERRIFFALAFPEAARLPVSVCTGQKCRGGGFDRGVPINGAAWLRNGEIYTRNVGQNGRGTRAEEWLNGSGGLGYLGEGTNVSSSSRT